MSKAGDLAQLMIGHIIDRLEGEAKVLESSDKRDGIGDRILVTKLGKEFVVKISDVEWLESSGNYVNLYVDNRAYPTRNTLSKLMETLSTKGFCQIHRSYGVNLDAIDSIIPLSASKSEVKLKSGKVISLSRRYREQLKHSFTVK